MKLPSITRYIYYLSITLILLTFGFNVVFLYNNFYKTITQVEIVYMLNSQVSFEIIDINLWDDIEKTIEHKKTPVLEPEEILKNPFASLIIDEELK